MTNAYSQVAENIIKEQETIIGPVALEQARKIPALEITDTGHVKINGNAKAALTDLVKQYEKLFGRASIEVCKEAVRSTRTTLAKEDLPEILQ